MDLHIALNRERPLRAQVERELRDSIRSGRLKAGAKLPASRMLAEALEISRGVVVEAYAQLVAEGYLVARPGDGTRVAGSLARTVPPRRPAQRTPATIRHDLRTGVPDLSLFPRRAWISATQQVLREMPDAALAYGSPGVLNELRRALLDHLGRVRAVVAEPEQTFITAGSMHGLEILCRTLRSRGALRIAVEDPAWTLIPRTVAFAGLEPVPVRVDGRGLIVSDLAATDVAAVVVSPAHQYPTGAVLAPDRRAQLLGWARESGGLIIEDDYDAEYRYDREPISALQGLAPDRVAYIGTVSKTLAPGVRLAWLIVPRDLEEELSALPGTTRPLPDVISLATYAHLLAHGAVDRHLRRSRHHYRKRRTLLSQCLARWLPDVDLGGASAGIHLIAWLPADADETAIAVGAAHRGVAIETLHRDFATVAPSPPALVIGYGSISELAIPDAVRALAASVSPG